MTSPIVPRVRELLEGTKVRFLLVGIWNTVFGYAAFWFLYEAFSRVLTVRYFAYTTAQVVSWIVAVGNAYLFHKHLTFRSKARGRAAVLEFLRFMQTYVAMFFLGLALLPFLVEVIGLSPKLAALVATGIGTVVSYVGHRFLTFRREEIAKPS